MNHTIDPAALWDTLQGALLMPDFCRALGLTADQMERQLRSRRPVRFFPGREFPSF